jgi:hypothetical protein
MRHVADLQCLCKLSTLKVYTVVVLYSDCTCDPRIGHYTELLLKRHNDNTTCAADVDIVLSQKKMAVTQVVFSKNALHMYTNALQMRQLPSSLQHWQPVIG